MTSPDSRDNFAKIATYLDNIVKIAAGFTVMTAFAGYVPVFLIFTNINIPTSFITYEQVIRAGILPSLLLFSLYFYFLTFMRPTSNRTWHSPAFLAFLNIFFIPFTFFLGLVGIIFIFCLTNFFLWISLFLIFLPVYVLGWLSELNRIWHLHYAFSTILTFLTFLIPIFLYAPSHMPKLFAKLKSFLSFFSDKINKIINKIPLYITQSASDVGSFRNGSDPLSGDQKWDWKPQFYQEMRMIFLKRIWQSNPAVFQYSIIGILALTWNTYMIGGAVIEKILLYVVLFILTLTAWLIFLIFVSSYILLSSVDKHHRRIGRWLSSILTAGSIIFAIILHSFYLYPRTPQWIGGGKPELVSVLLDPAALPVLNAHVGGGSSCVSGSGGVQCDQVLLYYHNQEYFIFRTKPGRSDAVLLSRRLVTSLSLHR
jgi:hypothetical protein